MTKMVYPGFIAATIRRLLNGDSIEQPVSEHQQNGLYAVHQLLIKLPNGPTLYRVLIAPADAPLKIGDTPADQHFTYPLGRMPTEE